MYIDRLKDWLMLRNLYNELSKMDLRYHALGELREDRIFLSATAIIPEGVDEVIRIKNLADTYNFCTLWDGHNIEITYCAE